MKRWGAALVALLAALVGCRTEPTAVVVVVHTDLNDGPVPLLRALRVRVRSDGPENGGGLDLPVSLGSRVGQYRLPASIVVRPLDGRSTGRAWVEVRGCAQDPCEETEPLVVQRAVFGYVPHETRRVDLFLTRTCLNVSCTDPLQTCRPTDGRCRDARLSIDETPRYDPSDGLDAAFPEGPPQERPGEEAGDAGAAEDARDAGDDVAAGIDAPRDEGGGEEDVAMGVDAPRDAGRDAGAANEASVDVAETGRDAPVSDRQGDAGTDRPMTDVPPRCGDDVCAIGESCMSCPLDCGGRPELCTTCTSCTATQALGWCSDLARCVPGTMRGPTGGECPESRWVWASVLCPAASLDAGAGSDAPTDVGCPVDADGGRAAPRDISAGAYHACAVLQDGSVRCWGRNVAGEVGAPLRNPAQPIATPTRVCGLEAAVDVECNGATSCAITSNGTVRCWGSVRGVNAPVPTLVSDPLGIPMTGARQLAVGWSHVCALMEDRTVRCWGDNSTGQLGDGTLVSRGHPAPVPNLRGVVQISAGRLHTCALMDDATMRCWGDGSDGQLAVAAQSLMRCGSASAMCSPSPLLVLDRGASATMGLSSVVEIRAGHEHTCARLQRGEIRCWGDTNLGSNGRYEPPAGVVEFAVGHEDLCIRLASGEVQCGGENGEGEVGDGTIARRRGSFVPGILSRGARISLGLQFGCAVQQDGTTLCWGSNEFGQIGDGTITPRTQPVPQRVLLGDVTHIEAMYLGDTYCALTRDGRIHCWGEQTFQGVRSPQPLALDGFSSAQDFNVWSFNLCALSQDATVRCAGFNSSGELGIGSTTPSASLIPVAPVTVGGAPLTMVRQVAMGQAHACAVLGGGELRCWGSNSAGQLGDGTMTNQTVAVPVPGIDRVDEVRAASSHTCARRGGSVYCWGDNTEGHLGNGTIGGRGLPPSPVQAIGGELRSATQIALGPYGGCAVTSDRRLLCWGLATNGRVPPQSAVAVEFLRMRDAAGVSGAPYGARSHACAWTADDGSVWCWGTDLSDGHRIVGSSATPVRVDGITGATQVAAAAGSACALLSDRTVRCWGDNSVGQLGNGTAPYRTRPTVVLLP